MQAQPNGRLKGCGVIDVIPLTEIVLPILSSDAEQHVPSQLWSRWWWQWCWQKTGSAEPHQRLFLQLPARPSDLQGERLSDFKKAIGAAAGTPAEKVEVLQIAAATAQDSALPQKTFVDLRVDVGPRPSKQCLSDLRSTRVQLELTKSGFLAEDGLALSSLPAFLPLSLRHQCSLEEIRQNEQQNQNQSLGLRA